MKMATLITTTLLLGSTLAQADNSPFSANVALGTDYIFRGVSQTLEDPAISGGFDFNHESGFYLGTWGSNVDFFAAGDAGDQGADMELDVYLCYQKDLGSGIGMDVGFIRYLYPSTDDLDFNEYYAKFSMASGQTTFNASIYYSNEVFGTDNDSLYYATGIDFAINKKITLSGSVGLYDFENSIPDNYVDWKIGLAYELDGWGFDLSYTDTNDDGETLFGNNADGKAVFTISRSL